MKFSCSVAEEKFGEFASREISRIARVMYPEGVSPKAQRNSGRK